MSDPGDTFTIPLEHTFEREELREQLHLEVAGSWADVEALRRGGWGRARCRDALRLHLARTPLRGRGRDRSLAHRRPLVGRRTRSRVLAGRGARRRRLGSLSRPPRRPVAPRTTLGLRDLRCSSCCWIRLLPPPRRSCEGRR